MTREEVVDSRWFMPSVIGGAICALVLLILGGVYLQGREGACRAGLLAVRGVTERVVCVRGEVP